MARLVAPSGLAAVQTLGAAAPPPRPAAALRQSLSQTPCLAASVLAAAFVLQARERQRESLWDKAAVTLRDPPFVLLRRCRLVASHSFLHLDVDRKSAALARLLAGSQ